MKNFVNYKNSKVNYINEIFNNQRIYFHAENLDNKLRLGTMNLKNLIVKR